MRRRLALLALLPLLAACASPQERCIAQASANLRTVDRLIQETEANLQRGYALEPTPVSQTVWVPCHFGPVDRHGHRASSMCLDDRTTMVNRPKTIDLAEEKRKLDQLRSKRAGLDRGTRAAILQCQASYPEAG